MACLWDQNNYQCTSMAMERTIISQGLRGDASTEASASILPRHGAIRTLAVASSGAKDQVPNRTPGVIVAYGQKNTAIDMMYTSFHYQM